MDKEAASRGTTVYLVDKRIDMLPALLGTSKTWPWFINHYCLDLCSLQSNVDRLAFSCIWVILLFTKFSLTTMTTMTMMI